MNTLVLLQLMLRHVLRVAHEALVVDREFPVLLRVLPKEAIVLVGIVLWILVENQLRMIQDPRQREVIKRASQGLVRLPAVLKLDQVAHLLHFLKLLRHYDSILQAAPFSIQILIDVALILKLGEPLPRSQVLHSQGLVLEKHVLLNERPKVVPYIGPLQRVHL